MSGFKEYDRYDGLGLAELVKKKEISAVELCEEAIARIEKINPKELPTSLQWTAFRKPPLPNWLTLRDSRQ